jgi:hypothetical protein
MEYKIHINKATKPKKNIEFIQKNDNETVESLIINIASNAHLNNKKTQEMARIYLPESIPKK